MHNFSLVPEIRFYFEAVLVMLIQYRPARADLDTVI